MADKKQKRKQRKQKRSGKLAARQQRQAAVGRGKQKMTGCVGHPFDRAPELLENSEWEQPTVLHIGGYEVSDEPIYVDHPPEVEQWAGDAVAALRRGDGKTAERLLRQCLKANGDKPDLLNNLASAYQIQGRDDEALQLCREVHERWPDYFFGRIGMAKLAAREGDFDRAKELISPLLERRRLHTTEFTALCSAQYQLALGLEDIPSALSWTDMWIEAAPDDSSLIQRRRLLIVASAASRLIDYARGPMNRRTTSRRGGRQSGRS